MDEESSSQEYWFSLDGREETEERIREFYEENGFVVITGVLSHEEIQASLHEIAGLVNVDYDDPSTYDQFSGNRFGVVGKSPLCTPCMNANRVNPKVRKAYEIVYGKERAISPCFDRAAWMRPPVDNPGWATPFKAPGIHLDISPFAYFEEHEKVDKFLSQLTYSSSTDFVGENNAKHSKMGLQLQAVLNLVDNEEENGGFHCVPGGHKRIPEWFASAKNRLAKNEPCGRYIFDNRFKEDQLLCSYTMRVCSPAGSLIIFDCLLPHGTQPNYSSKNRIIQFLRYIPLDTFKSAKTRKNRENAVKRALEGRIKS